MEIKDAYKQKMDTQLREWGAQIDLLEAKIENAGADARIKHAGELHELRAKWLVASEKMQEFERSGGEAWGEVKKATDKIWEDIKLGVSNAHAKLK